MKKKRDFSKIYSYSKLGLFDKCKKQYHFYYLDPEIAPIKKQFKKQRDYQTKGLAVHGAITLFYHLPVQDRTFENLKECLKNAWFSEIEPDKKPPLGKAGGFNSLKHERKVYYDTLRLLKNFFNLEDLNPSLFFLPTANIKNSFDDYENLITPLSGEFFISGKFDRIDKFEDGTLKIIDFKTARKNQDRFQLDFYRLLAELNFDLKVKTASFYYLDSGKIKEFDVSNLGKEKIKEQILNKIKIIENTKEFLPKTSSLCNHCDFKEICPAFEQKD